MQKVEGFFQSFDMFSAPATLRAKGSSSVTRTSAGVISFILFCYFAYIFIFGMYKIFTYESITSSQTFQKIPLTKIYAQNFMFGVGNLRLDGELLGSFSIKTSIVTNKNGVIQNMTMTQCQPKQWEKLGEDYIEQFNLHFLDKFLCPTHPQKLKLINSTLLEDAVFFQIVIQQAPNTPMDKYAKVLSQLSEGETNKFNLFYLDQAVIPNQEQAVQFFVNVNNFAYISPLKKHQTLLRLYNFEVSTDYSIIPLVNNYVNDEGQSISDAVLADVDATLETSNSKITFTLTNDKYIYYRRVGKIDEMFSYAGGLFALVIWCLAYFVGSFNQYRYELMVAENIFNFDKDGNKFLEKQFNFLKYIKFSAYGWIEKYLCFKPKWSDCQKIEETIAEANDQMDVMRLFRKLQFLQMALIHSSNQNENFINALAEPRSLQEVKQQRLILEYYFNIIKGEPAATVGDAMDGNAKRFKNLADSMYKYSQNPVGIQSESLSSQEKMISPNLEIKQKLMEYLNLSEREDICEAIANYPAALEQAKLIVLNHELQQIQGRLTNYFLNMELESKAKLMVKIPLKIIHRLCLRSQEMRSRKEEGEQQLKNE